MAQKRKFPKLGKDEVALFDFLLESISTMPKAQKRALGHCLMALLACTEDGILNMDRVARLVNSLGDGVSFDMG